MTSMQIDNAWEIYRAYNIKRSNAWFDDVLWAYAVRCAYAGHEPVAATPVRPMPQKPARANVARMAGIRKP